MNRYSESLDDHSRTIIHLDLDCFYAQVEMIKNPSLYNVPLGIQQKNILVTSNYIARKYGIKKCMRLSDGKKICPNLTIVNGEDLHDYRQTSYKVTEFLHQYSNMVERLGLDENFVDVTDLVIERLEQKASESTVVGHIVGDTSGKCQCGCEARLIEGTHIAQEMRSNLHKELKLTSCAGVSHNKLLAKIVCSQHKPNQQSVVFPNSALELMLSLNSIINIPGIGRTTVELLESVNIRTVEDLQNASVNALESILGKDKIKCIQQMSYGIDESAVKNTGRPQSIGIEDSCKPISAEKEIKEKLSQLLSRLLILVEEDGRIPRTIKVTVRKFDRNKVSLRETRQCNINSSLFNSHNVSQLTPETYAKIMKIIMTLFSKVVNVDKSYHITLLGLAFTKFHERPNLKNSIASFLKKNLEVQSITNIENNANASPCSSDDSSPNISNLNLKTSQMNLEPAHKKLKLNSVSKVTNDNDSDDCDSPLKLKHENSETPKYSGDHQSVEYPPDIDITVFTELPLFVQKELWDDYRNKNKILSHKVQSATNEQSNTSASPCSSSDISHNISNLNLETSKLHLEPACEKLKSGSISKRRNNSEIDDCASPLKLKVDDLYSNTPSRHSCNQHHHSPECPPNIDVTVFKELPSDVQNELWSDYRNKNKVILCPRKTKQNSLLNYFDKV